MEGLLFDTLELMYTAFFRIEQEEAFVPKKASPNPEFHKMWEAIKSSAQEYKEYDWKEFKDVAGYVTFSQVDSTSGKAMYYCELSQYHCYAIGYDKEALLDEIKREFTRNQKEMRIKKCLSL